MEIIDVLLVEDKMGKSMNKIEFPDAEIECSIRGGRRYSHFRSSLLEPKGVIKLKHTVAHDDGKSHQDCRFLESSFKTNVGFIKVFCYRSKSMLCIYIIVE